MKSLLWLLKKPHFIAANATLLCYSNPLEKLCCVRMYLFNVQNIVQCAKYFDIWSGLFGFILLFRASWIWPGGQTANHRLTSSILRSVMGCSCLSSEMESKVCPAWCNHTCHEKSCSSCCAGWRGQHWNICHEGIQAAGTFRLQDLNWVISVCARAGSILEAAWAQMTYIGKRA